MRLECNLESFVQFQKREKHHGGVLILVKLQDFKSNTPPWVFFMFFKLYKWYQLAQRIIYGLVKGVLRTLSII